MMNDPGSGGEQSSSKLPFVILAVVLVIVLGAIVGLGVVLFGIVGDESSSNSSSPNLPGGATCATAVKSIKDPFPAPTGKGLAQRGTGAIGALQWSVNTSAVMNGSTKGVPNVYAIVARTPTLVVLADAGFDRKRPITVVARRLADGKTAWARSLPPRAGKTGSALPVVQDGMMWSPMFISGRWNVAGLDLATGNVVACVRATSTADATPWLFASGQHVYELTYRPGVSEILQLGPDAPTWRASGQYTIVLGGSERTLVVGTRLSTAFPGSEGGLVGLDRATGRPVWEKTMRELTANTASYDGAPTPVWSEGASRVAGVVRGLDFAGPAAVQTVGAQTFVGFSWSPTEDVADKAVSAYTFNVDADTGAVAFAGYAWRRDVPPLADGRGNLTLVSPVTRAATQEGMVFASPAGAKVIPNSASYGGSVLAGRVIAGANRAGRPLITLFDVERGAIGELPVTPGAATAPYGTGALTDTMWVGMVRTAASDGGKRTFALSAYTVTPPTP